MSKRREFSRAVRIEIVKRATKNGVVYCEGCGLPAKRWEVDHTDPDAMQVDKSRPLTAADGKVLCEGSPECCHDIKTARDHAAIAKAKRNEAKALRVATKPAKPIKSAGFAKSPKAAAQAVRGPKQTLPPRIWPGFVSATASRDRSPG